MKLTSEELSDLLARVEAATGPDRELDGAIHNALFGTNYVRSTGSVTGFMTSPTDNGNPPVERYTASIDAALALALKIAPDANNHGYDTVNGMVYAYVSLNNVSSGHWISESWGSTVPLAFVAVAIRRSAKEPSNG
jgi:hypothetical protein